jgi:hypothetical protein
MDGRLQEHSQTDHTPWTAGCRCPRSCPRPPASAGGSPHLQQPPEEPGGQPQSGANEGLVDRVVGHNKGTRPLTAAATGTGTAAAGIMVTAAAAAATASGNILQLLRLLLLVLLWPQDLLPGQACPIPQLPGT